MSDVVVVDFVVAWETTGVGATCFGGVQAESDGAAGAFTYCHLKFLFLPCIAVVWLPL